MIYTRVYRVKIHRIHPTLPPLETNRRLVHECWICREGLRRANFEMLEIDIEINKNLHTTMKKTLRFRRLIRIKKFSMVGKDFIGMMFTALRDHSPGCCLRNVSTMVFYVGTFEDIDSSKRSPTVPM